MEPKLCWDILDDKDRQELLPKLAFLKEEGFYLAGGTGLALQIGHRTSLDFDFYKKEEFSPGELQNIIVSRFGVNRVKTTNMTTSFLGLEIDGIEVTFFLYPYNLVDKLLEPEFGYLASIKDIGAMKLIAIVQRGTKRDFIDIYCLIKQFGLKTLLEVVQKKYPGYNTYVGLQALLYFKDAEKSDEYKNRFNPLNKFDWPKIKQYIAKQVFALQKKL